MYTYIKHIQNLDSIKYTVFLVNSDYIYLLLDDPIETSAKCLLNSYCRILDMYLGMPILPKYDKNESKIHNLLLIKDNIKNEIVSIKNKLEILKTGNIETKLFDDDFFSRWSFGENFLLISYLIKYHPVISGTYVKSKLYPISKCYVDIEYDITNSLNFMINNEYPNQVTLGQRLQKKSVNQYLYNKIFELYPSEYFDNITDIKTVEFIKKMREHIEFHSRISKNTKQEIKIEDGKIVINDYRFPLNSSASIIAADNYKYNNCTAYDAYNLYIEKLEEEDEEININYVFGEPEYYESTNVPKIFTVENLDITNLSQEYLEIVFNLVVNGEFTIVNLYRCTHGDLSIFKSVELLTENVTLDNMYRDLENNEDILEYIITSDDPYLKHFIFDYLVHCELKLTNNYKHKM